MAKIYTKTGDMGETSLVSGTRVSKASDRVMTYGEIDTTNSFIGLARAYTSNGEIDKILKGIQEKFLVIGAEIANDGKSDKSFGHISEEDVTYLEELIDKYDEKLPKLNHFIIPGESRVSSHFHVARTSVRTAERYVIALATHVEVNPYIISYLNRLSDLFFTLARYEAEVECK